MTRFLVLFLSYTLITQALSGTRMDSTAQKSGGAHPPYVPVGIFDPQRDAAKDIAEAITEATASGRRIILDVGGEWCIWCKRLDTLFLKQDDLRNFMHEKYVVVKVNYSKENENEEILSHYPEIEGYPHLFVLDTDGKLLHSQDTGLLESGKGHDPIKVREFLTKWAPPAIRRH